MNKTLNKTLKIGLGLGLTAACGISAYTVYNKTQSVDHLAPSQDPSQREQAREYENLFKGHITDFPEEETPIQEPLPEPELETPPVNSAPLMMTPNLVEDPFFASVHKSEMEGSITPQQADKMRADYNRAVEQGKPLVALLVGGPVAVAVDADNRSFQTALAPQTGVPGSGAEVIEGSSLESIVTNSPPVTLTKELLYKQLGVANEAEFKSYITPALGVFLTDTVNQTYASGVEMRIWKHSPEHSRNHPGKEGQYLLVGKQVLSYDGKLPEDHQILALANFGLTPLTRMHDAIEVIAEQATKGEHYRPSHRESKTGFTFEEEVNTQFDNAFGTYLVDSEQVSDLTVGVFAAAHAEELFTPADEISLFDRVVALQDGLVNGARIYSSAVWDEEHHDPKTNLYSGRTNHIRIGILKPSEKAYHPTTPTSVAPLKVYEPMSFNEKPIEVQQ